MSLPIGTIQEPKSTGRKESFHQYLRHDQIAVCGTQEMVLSVMAGECDTFDGTIEISKEPYHPPNQCTCAQKKDDLSTMPRDLPGPGQREPLLQEGLGFSNFK